MGPREKPSIFSRIESGTCVFRLSCCFCLHDVKLYVLVFEADRVCVCATFVSVPHGMRFVLVSFRGWDVNVYYPKRPR